MIKGEMLIVEQDSVEECFRYSGFKKMKVRIEDIQDYQRGITTLRWWFEDSGDNYDGYHTDRVEKLIDAIESGEYVPAIIISSDFRLYDGHHRLTAYTELGYKEVDAYVEVEVYRG